MTWEVTNPKYGDCFCETPNWITKHNHQPTRVFYWILTHQDVSADTSNASCNPRIVFSKGTLISH